MVATKSKLYSYALVGIQFTCIVFLVMQPNAIFSHSLAFFVFLLGVLVGIYLLSNIRGNHFNIIPEIKESAELITTGAYAYIRHPMYFSVLVMMLGFLLANPTIQNSAIYTLLITVLFLKAHKEEKLWMQKSKEYIAYKAKTKSIIPFVL